MLKAFQTIVLSVFFVVSAVTALSVHAQETADINAADETTELRSQLEQSERTNTYLKWSLGGLTAVYIFIYIMGRRRLMRKIWKRNRQLRTALEQADEAYRMKSSFIRSMSHEIRTPLNAINGFSQLLCSADMELTDEERQDMKDRIVENTETITEIINELLELAQSESQNLAMEFVVISEVCQEVLQRAEKGNEKGLRLQLHNEVGGRFRVKSNREIITHILEKIMDNAMKFTEKGSIIIRLAHPRRKLLEVSITDTGVGVPDAQREKIFDKFVKLDDYKGGVGLGLPICRHLARLLGGDVLLDAEYKKGSRFILQLPC